MGEGTMNPKDIVLAINSWFAGYEEFFYYSFILFLYLFIPTILILGIWEIWSFPPSLSNTEKDRQRKRE